MHEGRLASVSKIAIPEQAASKKASRLLARLSLALVLAGSAGGAAAALPVAPETPEAKVKAQEAAAKAAEAAKKASEDLGRYMDKAVENYKQRQVSRPAGG